MSADAQMSLQWPFWLRRLTGAIVLLAFAANPWCTIKANAFSAFITPRLCDRPLRYTGPLRATSQPSGMALLEQKYDGQAIEDYYQANPLPLVERMARIAPPVLSW